MTMEQLILKSIEELGIIANQAYWKDRSDCGADMTGECPGCQHYEICEANQRLKETLEHLKYAVL